MLRRLIVALSLAAAAALCCAYGILHVSVRKAAHMVGRPLADRSRIAFRVDADFTAVERELILEAFREIGRASGCVELTASFERLPAREMLSWRRDSHAAIYRAASPFSWEYHVSRHLAGPGSYMGIAMVTTGDVFIMVSERDEGPGDFRNTVIHEVLHVVFRSGWHSPRGDSLMHESIGGGEQKLLAEERTKLRAICAAVKSRKAVPNVVPGGHSDAHRAAVLGASGRLVQPAVEGRP